MKESAARRADALADTRAMTPHDVAPKDLAKAWYDYSGLKPELEAAEARTTVKRIHELGAQQKEAIVAIGRELVGIKRKLGHGHFGDWIKAKFGMSADTAERY